MKIILETERLFLSEMAEEDAPDFFRLNKDPEVMKYLHDRAFETVDETREFLKNYPSYKKYGYGRLTMRLKTTNEHIGWCGLKFNEDIQETDVGYRMHKQYWGNGYATEASIASVKYGFDTLGLAYIIGRADKRNIASIRVLEKTGLTFEKYYFEEGVENVRYIINNPL